MWGCNTSILTNLVSASRTWQTDLSRGWSSKYSRCHCIPQILQGTWPYEQRSRLHHPWGTRAIPHPGCMACGRSRGKQELTQSKWLYLILLSALFPLCLPRAENISWCRAYTMGHTTELPEDNSDYFPLGGREGWIEEQRKKTRLLFSL